MKRRITRNKRKTNRFIGCFTILVVIFLIVPLSITLVNSNTKSQTIEEQLKGVSKNTELNIEDKNALITIKNASGISSGNLFINVGFPEIVAKDLKILKNEGYENILIKVITDFVNDKGNEYEGVLMSALFENSTIQNINFENWITKITADSSSFYELSSAYYIQPKYYIDNKNEQTIPKYNSKTSKILFWNYNAYLPEQN
ncbi:hypothetical protein [Enterococcus ratti]|uniref:Uncharacterized protein n=1 Tax=Enterococcus ratti TaxID=150033 RepID=A0A1L8WIC5_9ENTE|nr:hypothetical protein [Enterococcus ratti]OJG80760.1 hypothetical protein RV14_GL000502 [Enterococcus ratti]